MSKLPTFFNFINIFLNSFVVGSISVSVSAIFLSNFLPNFDLRLIYLYIQTYKINLCLKYDIEHQ